MSSTLNLFSRNISRASSRLTTTRWNGCFSLMMACIFFSMPARSWSEIVRSPRKQS